MSAALTAYLDRLALPPREAADESSSGRAAASGSFLSQAQRAGLLWQLAGLIGAHLLETAILLASWACIGSGALSGRFDAGWLAAWALALGTTIPLHAATTWLQGVLSIGFGGLLKQRLLSGAMAIDNDLIRTKGAGGLLSEVLESEAIDQLGASGGVATVLALIELLVVPALFLWGAASAAEITVLIGWGILSGTLFARNFRLRAEWTRNRVGLTNRLIENMTAHRTRAAQQSPASWHLADDAALEHYVTASRRLDDGTAAIQAALPRGYVIAGFAALTPAFLSGTATLAELAISLGSILFAAASFERLCFGFSRGSAAWIAWKIIRPIFDAAGRAPLTAVIADMDLNAGERPTSVLQAREVGFTHANRHEPVLGGCSFTVERGDQILLEGASGSGKSTFASILAGSRSPSDGFVLAGGLDRQTLGDAAWRRRVALAPQYHDNHIVSGPLIFNLLMSREYPHAAADVEEAQAICLELGLGGLLERMPAGLSQIVGDTGWRLSQGERGRIFLARALLQKADVVVLDECLAALDPENLRQCLECIMRRCPTLIVIAHP
jgi:ATP-binding cassette subfamily B protein